MVVVKFLVLGVGIYCTRYYRIGTVTNQPTPGFLTNTTTLPQAVWALPRAVASEDHSSALGASTDHLPVDWRRPRGQPRQSWLRTIESDLKNAQPWTTLCIAASNGSSFLATHRGNSYAHRACHLMMMMG